MPDVSKPVDDLAEKVRLVVQAGGKAGDYHIEVALQSLKALLAREKVPIRHLEQRIFSQRRTITYLQGKLRERNVRTRSWFEGREAMLREQLREATSAMYGWKAEAEKLRRERDEARATLDPEQQP